MSPVKSRAVYRVTLSWSNPEEDQAPVTCPHFPNAPEPQVLRIAGDPRMCARRLLTIHAHPDDETTKGGGSVAYYAAAGVGTALVCCTGGEAGTVVNPALNRPEVQAYLAEVRRAELLAA